MVPMSIGSNNSFFNPMVNYQNDSLSMDQYQDSIHLAFGCLDVIEKPLEILR